MTDQQNPGGSGQPGDGNTPRRSLPKWALWTSGIGALLILAAFLFGPSIWGKKETAKENIPFSNIAPDSTATPAAPDSAAIAKAKVDSLAKIEAAIAFADSVRADSLDNTPAAKLRHSFPNTAALIAKYRPSALEAKADSAKAKGGVK